jgi:hypothetical protein
MTVKRTVPIRMALWANVRNHPIQVASETAAWRLGNLKQQVSSPNTSDFHQSIADSQFYRQVV